MSSSDKKGSLRKKQLLSKNEIFWLIIIVLAAIIMFWGLYQEFKDEAEFQKHKKNEQNN